MTFGDNIYPFRVEDVKRGLILFRTSNNASSYVNFEVVTARVDDLPTVARLELIALLRNVASDIEEKIQPGAVREVQGDDIAGYPFPGNVPCDGSPFEGLCSDKRNGHIHWVPGCRIEDGEVVGKGKDFDLPTRWRPMRPEQRTVPEHEKRHPVLNTFDWYFVQAKEENRNSYKLRGWFPTEELAKAHITSWPWDVGKSMSYIPARDFEGRSDGKKAPEHMQRSVTMALYNFYISQGVFASNFMKLPDGVIQAHELAAVTRMGTTDAAHVIYGRDDPDASDAIKDANGDIALGHCMVCGAGEIELEQGCDPKRDFNDLRADDLLDERPMVWILQERCNGVWANLGAPLKSEDAAERALEAIERADLDGQFVYRYRRMK